MTREEEIERQGTIYSDMPSNYIEWGDGFQDYDDRVYIERAFIEGAKWADKTMIEKACEWLESTLKSNLGYYGATDFADTFRKAMEEQL